MDRAKALAKIEKCLRLGKSPNEHEAAAAMRQAQHLMNNFGITEEEIGLIGYAMERVQTSIQVGKKLPEVLARVSRLIMHAFGVRVVYVPVRLKTDYNYAVDYYGRKDRVLLAGYAHTVVARACEQSWQKHLKENPRLKGVVGARSGFYHGWIYGVRSKLEMFAVPEDEKVAVERMIALECGEDLANAEFSNIKHVSSAVNAGYKLSESFNLYSPMTGKENLKIGN